MKKGPTYSQVLRVTENLFAMACDSLIEKIKPYCGVTQYEIFVKYLDVKKRAELPEDFPVMDKLTLRLKIAQKLIKEHRPVNGEFPDADNLFKYNNGCNTLAICELLLMELRIQGYDTFLYDWMIACTLELLRGPGKTEYFPNTAGTPGMEKSADLRNIAKNDPQRSFIGKDLEAIQERALKKYAPKLTRSIRSQVVSYPVRTGFEFLDYKGVYVDIGYSEKSNS